MNERIKELVIEAAEYCDENPTRGIKASDAFDQKFAELIVRECLVIAEQTHETKYGKMSCANDDETVRLIKERFGIE